MTTTKKSDQVVFQNNNQNIINRVSILQHSSTQVHMIDTYPFANMMNFMNENLLPLQENLYKYLQLDG